MELFKVVVINPVPEVKKGNSFEDTMLLLYLVKQQKQKENKEKKVNSISKLIWKFKYKGWNDSTNGNGAKKKNRRKGKIYKKLYVKFFDIHICSFLNKLFIKHVIKIFWLKLYQNADIWYWNIGSHEKSFWAHFSKF